MRAAGGEGPPRWGPGPCWSKLAPGGARLSTVTNPRPGTHSDPSALESAAGAPHSAPACAWPGAGGSELPPGRGREGAGKGCGGLGGGRKLV